MSVTTCSITIYNQSHSPKRFLLFQDAPSPTNGPSGKVFWNVYQASPRIEDGEDSKTRFEMDNEFFAIYGTASTVDVGNVRVYTSNSKKVKLGPDGTFVALKVEKGDPKWNDEYVKDKKSAAKGGFSIMTNDFDYPNENNVYIGVGAKDPKHPKSVIPIQTYIAEPSLNSQLFPHMKYYICTGEYQPGTVVDRNLIGDALKVDFTGAAVTNAVFTVDSKGKYTDEDGVNEKNGIKWEMSPVEGA